MVPLTVSRCVCRAERVHVCCSTAIKLQVSRTVDSHGGSMHDGLENVIVQQHDGACSYG
jgi:hypothetical protein